MKNAHATAVMLAVVALLGACSPDKPPAEALRPVRTVPLSYDTAGEAHRYVGTVQSRHEVDQAFRVGGKVVQRKVDVGQSVREGEVIAVLDDADYRLAEQALSQQLIAATAQARQAESDRDRLAALKTDGSVSESDEERAHSSALSAKAAAEAKARELELARNKLKYTVLRSPRAGVVTAVRFEVGQVVAEGQPVVSIAGHAEPEIVVDVPEDHLASFKGSSYKAWLASAPEQKFDLVLRELSPQAAAQTRTYRARLKPATARAAAARRHGHGGGRTRRRRHPGRGDPGQRDDPARRQAGGLGGAQGGQRSGGQRRAARRGRARLPQRPGARLRSAGRRTGRDRRRAEDGPGTEGRAALARAR